MGQRRVVDPLAEALPTPAAFPGFEESLFDQLSQAFIAPALLVRFPTTYQGFCCSGVSFSSSSFLLLFLLFPPPLLSRSLPGRCSFMSCWMWSSALLSLQLYTSAELLSLQLSPSVELSSSSNSRSILPVDNASSSRCSLFLLLGEWLFIFFVYLLTVPFPRSLWASIRKNMERN